MTLPSGEADRCWAAQEAPIRDLVQRFTEALHEKLIASERKHGWNNGGWRDDWQSKCQADLLRHIEKGDPRDVAAYCAFMWHHGWNTSMAPVQEQVWNQKGMLQERDAEIERLRKLLQEVSDAAVALPDLRGESAVKTAIVDRIDAELAGSVIHPVEE